jgi:transcriptional regulator with XRE-family HTH domain
MNDLSIIGGRLREYLRFKKVTINELARLTNTGAGQIHNIIKGKKYGIDKMLNIFIVLPKLNIYWLINGEGVMELDDKGSKSFKETSFSLKQIEADVEQNSRYKIENEKMQATITYQEMTIEAYKRSLDIISLSNEDLKKMMEFFKKLSDSEKEPEYKSRGATEYRNIA